MEYFECSVPTDNGLCSDNACPCPEAVIPRGKGYLYIEQSLVDFRRKYPAIESARRVMQQERKQLQQTLARNSDRQEIFYRYRLGPILVCEDGAKLRNLDLKVAAADAKHWWETGLVPLRATPIAKEPGLTAVNTETKGTAQTTSQDKDVDNKINMLWDSAKKLGWSETDCKKKISIYTEVLGFVDKSSKYNACALLRNRAISYRNLKKFEEALNDLQRELEIAQKIGDKWRIMKCRKAIEQTRKLKHKDVPKEPVSGSTHDDTETHARARAFLNHMDQANMLAVFAHKALQSKQTIRIGLHELDAVIKALSDALQDHYRNVESTQIIDILRVTLTAKCVECGIVFPWEAIASTHAQLLAKRFANHSIKHAKCPKCNGICTIEVVFDPTAIDFRNEYADSD